MDRWLRKVAVVTGAGQGIGEAIARRLARSGMTVAALDRRKDLLDKLMDDVTKQGSVGVIKKYLCDIKETDDVKKVFKNIKHDLGPNNVIVNNAGVFNELIVTDVDLKVAETMMGTNILGMIKCTNEAVALMKANSINDGHIINISSMAVWMDPAELPQYGFYAASKLAVSTYSRSLKAQLLKEGMKTRVTAICPGLVDTPMVREVLGDIKSTPHLMPADIAEVVAAVLAAPSQVNVHEILVGPT